MYIENVLNDDNVDFFDTTSNQNDTRDVLRISKGAESDYGDDFLDNDDWHSISFPVQSEAFYCVMRFNDFQ